MATHYVCGFYYNVWYERGSRTWTIQATDGNGNQVGDTQSAPTRDMALIYLGIEAYSFRNTHQHAASLVPPTTPADDNGPDFVLSIGKRGAVRCERA